jgi:KDO2-lipid IV(A) lauroyltransferase
LVKPLFVGWQAFATIAAPGKGVPPVLRQGLDFAVYVFIRVLIGLVRAVPLSVCGRGAEVLATLAARVLRIRQHVVDENLRIAFPKLTEPERAEIAWKMWRHLFLMCAEIAHTPRKVHRTNWREHSRIVDLESFVRTLLSGRPLVVISAHYGNFELGGYLMGLFGFPTYTVARKLDNPYLDQFINRFRGRTGQYILEKQGSGTEIKQVLDAGGILTLLGDQSAGKKGCWVKFFGRPASTHKAVSLFSLGSDAPTMVSYARRIGRPLEYEVGPQAIVDPLEPGFTLRTVPLLAQWYTDQLEDLIREAPEQYWWLHRRWKGQPTARAAKSSEQQATAA